MYILICISGAQNVCKQIYIYIYIYISSVNHHMHWQEWETQGVYAISMHLYPP